MYLLERQIENGKLYHRSCYRHSDLSPTSSLFKNSSSSFANFSPHSGYNAGSEKAKSTENKPSWVKGEVTSKSDVPSWKKGDVAPKSDDSALQRNKPDLKKNLLHHDDDVEMTKSEPKEDSVITRYLNQMKEKEPVEVPKYQKKRPLIFQMDNDREDKQSKPPPSKPPPSKPPASPAQQLSSKDINKPHSVTEISQSSSIQPFGSKVHSKPEAQTTENKNTKDKLKQEINTRVISGSKSEQTFDDKTKLSPAVKDRGISNARSKENVKVSIGVLDPLPKAKERNLAKQPQTNTEQKTDLVEGKRPVIVSPVAAHRTAFGDAKPVRKSVSGRPKTPPPQLFKSGQHLLISSSSSDSPDSPPPLPLSQPPSAPSSAEKSNIKSLSTSKNDAASKPEFSLSPVPKARQNHQPAVQESTASAPAKPSRVPEISIRTEVPMEIDNKGPTQTESFPSDPNKDNKNVLSGLLKSLSHVRQAEDIHSSSQDSVSKPSVSVSSANWKMSDSSLSSTNSSITVSYTSTKTTSKDTSRASESSVCKKVPDSDVPSNKIGFLKKDVKNKFLQDSKHPAPSHNKDLRTETKSGDNKSQDVSSRIGNRTNVKLRPKSAFVTADTKPTEGEKSDTKNVPSWKKELGKKDKLKSKSTENLWQTDKLKIQQDDNIPSWKKELEKNKTKKSNVSHDGDKHASGVKDQKVAEVIPSWKKELKKNEAENIRIKSSQDNGKHYTGVKDTSQKNEHVPNIKNETTPNVPSWKKQNDEKSNIGSRLQQESEKPSAKTSSSESNKNIPFWKKTSDVNNAEKSGSNLASGLSQGKLDSKDKTNVKDKPELRPETKMPVPKKRGLHAVNGEVVPPFGKTDQPKTTEHPSQMEVDDNSTDWQMEAKRRLQKNQRQFVDPERMKASDFVAKTEPQKMTDQPQTPEIVSNKNIDPGSNVYHSTPKSSEQESSVKQSTPKSPVSLTKVGVPARPPGRPPTPPPQRKKIPVETKFSFNLKPYSASNNNKTPSVSPIGPAKNLNSPKKLTPPRPPPPKVQVSCSK